MQACSPQLPSRFLVAFSFIRRAVTQERGLDLIGESWLHALAMALRRRVVRREHTCTFLNAVSVVSEPLASLVARGRDAMR